MKKIPAMIKTMTAAFLLTSMLAAPAMAKDVDISLASTLVQNEFSDLAKQVGLVISYKPLSPAEPLGILGFDAGVEVSTVDIDSGESFWTKTISDPPGTIVVPKLHVQKGLPFGFDVGVVYSKIPSSNISYIGAELKYAIMKGSIALPAISIRGTYTTMMGVDDLDINTYGADISISKGIALATPYLGVGQTFVNATENSALVDLESENVSMTHAFAGIKISLLLLNFVAEADIAEVPTYSFRANIGF